MNVKYVRISTPNQKVERQLMNQLEFDKIYIDVCSGAIPFNERDQAKRLLRNKKVSQITIKDITRLGRNMNDILSTIEYFVKLEINLYIENLGISTMVDNKKNSTAALMINLLSSISEYERELIKERTQQGREIAKARGKYKGRKRGTQINDEDYKRKYLKDIEAVKSMLERKVRIMYISKELKIPRSRIYQFKKRGLI
jgi:DNA invertase Pin-like site-specific DNA recombinase